LFDEPSPVDLIWEIKPDIYIKGDNYNLNLIDREERKALESYGVEIRFCTREVRGYRQQGSSKDSWALWNLIPGLKNGF
jgi:hypothetical protein